MEKKMYCKTLVIGIIVLFIGANISSAFAVDTNQYKAVSQNKECQECDKSESGICDLLEILFAYIMLIKGKYTGKELESAPCYVICHLRPTFSMWLSPRRLT